MDFHLCFNVFTNGNIAVSCSPEQNKSIVGSNTTWQFSTLLHLLSGVGGLHTFNEDGIGTQVRVSEVKMALRQL